MLAVLFTWVSGVNWQTSEELLQERPKREENKAPPPSAPLLHPTPHCDRAGDRQLGWELPPEDERLTAWEEAEGDIKPDQRLLGRDCNGMQMKTLTPLAPMGKGSARP